MFLHRIVTGDEKWIHYDDPKRRKSWGHRKSWGYASTSSTKPNIEPNGSKLLLCIWWDHQVIICYELLKTNETITEIAIDFSIDAFESIPKRKTAAMCAEARQSDFVT